MVAFRARLMLVLRALVQVAGEAGGGKPGAPPAALGAAPKVVGTVSCVL
jgi:hypothetical protein